MPQNSDAPFKWRSIALSAFGPSLLFGLSEGAIFPIMAVSARALGASVGEAGVIATLLGIGALLGNVPAALITTRHGERKAMLAGAIVSVLTLLLCVLTTSTLLLSLGLLLFGMASSVFLLARLTYLTEAVPIAMRARALSTLGGCTRAGMFIGPFCAAALMPWLSLDGAYWVAIAAMLGVGALAFSLPELTVPQSRAAASAPEKKPPAPRLLQTFREHRRAYLTLGLVGAMVNGIRSCRQVTIPLWGLHIGLDPATTTLIYGMMGAMDLLLFYPSGRIMDLRGRRWVAVPSMLLMSGGFAWMIMSSSTLNFALSCMMIGVGNGMGAGLIMTIGADVSPPHARTQFLGGWRFLSDAGSSAAPILVSAIAAAASLALGISLIAAVGLFTAGLFWRWLPKDNKPARVP